MNKKFEYFKDYFWRLRVKNGIYHGKWSETRKFTTGISFPTLVSPANNLLDVKKDIIFFWNTVDGADVYQIQVAKDDKFTNKLVDQDSLNNGRFQKDGFPYDTKLFWRVKAKYAMGQSIWSEIWNLTTEKENEKGVLDDISGMEANLYPNPFSEKVSFEIKMPRFADLSITILDISGAEITTIHSGRLESGNYLFTWEPKNLPQGSYICKFKIDSRTYFGKLNFIK